MPILRLILVDDHPVVRAGLAGMLSAEDDIDVVGEAGDGEEALALVRELRPDVVVMDLRMPLMGGADATALILREAPDTRVLILTTYDTDADILRAVEAGATGYLLKDTPRAQFADAVRSVARGQTVIAEPVAARLVNHLREPLIPKLTARETEVLALVAQGKSNSEIATVLFIGEATVKTHLLRVFAKLGVDDRTRAVTKAQEIGVLQ